MYVLQPPSPTQRKHKPSPWRVVVTDPRKEVRLHKASDQEAVPKASHLLHDVESKIAYLAVELAIAEHKRTARLSILDNYLKENIRATHNKLRKLSLPLNSCCS